MSQPEIPDNNLPVYLQQYKVYIFNKNYPDCKTTCASSEAGCCADDVTPVPPGGLCPIGGCAGTEFGCCPFSTEAKQSRLDTCGVIAGKATYNTVGAIPSNEAGKRVWELNLLGELEPNHPVYYIVYDFQRVDYKDKITFENIVTGTLNICGRVLDASKYIEKSFCDGNRTLTIKIDTRKWDFRFRKKVRFSYRLNVDDSSYCKAVSPSYTPDSKGNFTITPNVSPIYVLLSINGYFGYLIMTVTTSSITVTLGKININITDQQLSEADRCATITVTGNPIATKGDEAVTFEAAFNDYLVTYTQCYQLQYGSSNVVNIKPS